MKTIRFSIVIIVAAAIIFGCISSLAAEYQALKKAEEVIDTAIPKGWKIVSREYEQIPWGHHWCYEYRGVTGTKLIARGTEPVRSQFLGDDDRWRKVIVGKEALKIWIMPSNYKEGWRNWLCIHRPIQPTFVVKNKQIRLYARPSSHSSQDEERIFKNELSKSKAVQSPNSPWNKPENLSWNEWINDLNYAFQAQK